MVNMYIKTTEDAINEIVTDSIVIGVYEDKSGKAYIDESVTKYIKNWSDFTSELGKVRVFYPSDEMKANRLICVGLGKQNKINIELIRTSVAAGIKQAKEFESKSVSIDVNSFLLKFDLSDIIFELVETTLLTLYEYSDDPLKSHPDLCFDELMLITANENTRLDLEKIINEAESIASGVFLSRDLVNMPPNKATPSYMADVARNIGELYGMRVTIGDREWAKTNKMGAFLAVAKGAGEPPKFIVLEHNHSLEDKPAIVIVGKGITFDSGGISIKPSQDMGKMKSDMAGASVVLGVMQVVGKLNLPYRIIGIAPCTENMPDANAYHPADVIEASNGKTIEIISTDAEGRMVLADALVYAQQYSPDAVIDLATLTGACVIALGKNVAAGLFSNNEKLQERLLKSAKSTNERLWLLPLFEDYKMSIETKVADVKNSGGRFGGVGTSAAFLKEFVNYPWAHIDMAGMALAEKTKSYVPEGGTGFGVRLIIDFIINWGSSEEKVD